MAREEAEQQIREWNQQVEELYGHSKYAELLALARKVCELARRELGDDHADTATSLSNLGTLLKDTGDLEGARAYREQALAIRRRVLGEEHPDTARSLNDLGSVFWAMGDLAGARPYLEQALAIRRRVLGEDHADTATSLSNLGSLLWDRGDLAGARPYLERALAIRRGALGEGHPRTARSLNNFGWLFAEMGDIARALPLVEQALAIRRRVLGDDHPDTATSLNNLGMLLKDRGDLVGALPYLEQALAIHRRALGEGHPLTATSLSNLGDLLSGMGDAGALTCCEEALAIRRRVLGEDHPDTARSFNNLGLVLVHRGDLVGARPHLEQALAIHRRVLGDDHPDTAAGMDNVGLLLCLMGNQAAARSLLGQALEIFCRTLGEEHPATAWSCIKHAFLEATSGQADEALVLLRRATASEDHRIGQMFSIGSDRQRLLFLETIQGTQDFFISLVFGHLSPVPGAVRSAFDLVLRRKALGAEALAAQRDAVLGGCYPELRVAFDQLTQMRQRIVQKSLVGPSSGETVEAHQQVLHQWREEQQTLETVLVRQIPELNVEQQLQQAERRAVALGLPEGVALIEFVRFDVFDFDVAPARRQPARYLGFVLAADLPDAVQMIDLGEACPIDRMIADFRASVTVDPQDRPGRDIHRHPPGSPAAGSGQVGPELRSNVFEKLVPALGGCNRLLLAPDGDLALLPFEVLPSAEGRILLEQYRISYLSCGRDVLRFGGRVTRPAGEPLVVADPFFDLAADAGSPGPAAATPSRCSRDFKRADYHFPRLPGTREEGERVASLLGVRPWLDGEALEGRLKGRRSPRVLHLATHGFFLTDQERDRNKGSRALERIGAEPGRFGRLSGPLPENPLLRSGLALAGAQAWRDGKALPPEAEDGLLTAEDVAGLDLLDTELVVLSACDTGLGEVRIGEGVFGLRRAFVVAGARTLVMSLWKVPDEQTRELMIDFYHRVLAGQGVADALREAQLAMREKHPDPYYWGAFICQGDPGPLGGG
jgi:CHAT domain-containing protein/tetratricopeptide (TPR) repeat protein